MFCSNCGQENVGGTFCARCGMQVQQQYNGYQQGYQTGNGQSYQQVQYNRPQQTGNIDATINEVSRSLNNIVSNFHFSTKKMELATLGIGLFGVLIILLCPFIKWWTIKFSMPGPYYGPETEYSASLISSGGTFRLFGIIIIGLAIVGGISVILNYRSVKKSKKYTYGYSIIGIIVAIIVGILSFIINVLAIISYEDYCDKKVINGLSEYSLRASEMGWAMRPLIYACMWLFGASVLFIVMKVSIRKRNNKSGS